MNNKEKIYTADDLANDLHKGFLVAKGFSLWFIAWLMGQSIIVGGLLLLYALTTLLLIWLGFTSQFTVIALGVFYILCGIALCWAFDKALQKPSHSSTSISN